MTWIQVGAIGVDSGTVTVGDACYQLSGDALAKVMGHDGKAAMFGVRSGEFNRVTDPNRSQVVTNDHQEFVTVQSGFGDGSYPVYVRIDDASGRVAEIRVVFIEEHNA